MSGRLFIRSNPFPPSGIDVPLYRFLRGTTTEVQCCPPSSSKRVVAEVPADLQLSRTVVYCLQVNLGPEVAEAARKLTPPLRTATRIPSPFCGRRSRPRSKLHRQGYTPIARSRSQGGEGAQRTERTLKLSFPMTNALDGQCVPRRESVSEPVQLRSAGVVSIASERAKPWQGGPPMIKSASVSGPFNVASEHFASEVPLTQPPQVHAQPHRQADSRGRLGVPET